MAERLEMGLALATLIIATGCAAGSAKETPCLSPPETATVTKPEQSTQAETETLENTGEVLVYSAEPIELPAPLVAGGMPLYEALKKRKSDRDFSEGEIRLDMLSQLLWAAVGVNRKDGRRTSPTAHNRQDIAVYVVTKAGLFEYIADGHTLKPIHDKDIRKAVGKQEFAVEASLNLVYVSDLSTMGETEPLAARTYAGAHAGAASQNVYLFCAAVGLNTVVRAYFDGEELADAMNLKMNHVPILAQTVGLP